MKSPRDSKYYPLYVYLLGRPKVPWRVSFPEIEDILDIHLPSSARDHREWWSNSRTWSNHALWLIVGCESERSI
jgi:hypothetical protein